MSLSLEPTTPSVGRTIEEFPIEILWAVIEYHLYNHTKLYWQQDLYYRSLIGNNLSLDENGTINEIAKLRSVCKAFKRCISKNVQIKGQRVFIIKRKYLLHHN
jgi:hypothetical protein